MTLCQKPSHLIRIKTVIAMTGLSRSTIYERMKRGEFPRSVQLSVRHVAWREREVLDWIETLPTCQGNTWRKLPEKNNYNGGQNE